MTALGRPRMDVHRDATDERGVVLLDDRNTVGSDFGLLLVRGTVGAFLVLAGYVKSQLEPGQWMEQYTSTLGAAGFSFLPDWLTATYGQALPYLAMIVGALLIVGLFGRFAGGVGFFMVASFMVASVISQMPPDTSDAPRSMISRIWLPISNDGAGPFSANIILMAVMLLFLFSGVGRIGFDGLLFRRKTKLKRAEG